MKIIKNVVEFGAIGDGVHDDYHSIQAALDCGADEIIIPQGIYNISKTLLVKSNTRIVADKTAKIVMKSSVRRKRNEFLLSNSDMEKGNSNIEITGGIWDGNNKSPENAKADLFDKNGYSGTTLNFVNIDGLTLKDMVLANSVTYYIRMCKVHNFTIEDIDFVSDSFGQNQDGLHFGGDVKHGNVKNIRALTFGQTNDDIVALNADDSIERVENLDLCRASIEDITFENIYAENCHTIIRMLSVTAEIKNIRFKNIYGGFRCNAINADAARYCMIPLFREEDCPDGVGKISDIYIDNFVCRPITHLPEDFGGTRAYGEVALKLESHMDNFNITQFRYIGEVPEEFQALVAKNLVREKIQADGVQYCLNKKEDIVKLKNFKNLSVNSINN